MFQDWRHIKHFGDCSHFIDIVCGHNCQLVQKRKKHLKSFYCTIQLLKLRTSNLRGNTKIIVNGSV